ncbi:MAG: PHP domain-containing protein, partial [Acidimicrobiia bacterium]
SDIRGYLHDHTDQSGDGRASLEEMVAAASERGYQYLAITDHGEDLVVNGQPREVFLVQREQIVALQEAHPETALLHGCELNIGRDGGLDYDPDFRMGFAWCVASVHSHFDLDQARQTERLLRAMADPAVNVIGHLTGRMIGRRPGIELDVEAVLEGAAELGVALEVNGALDRLDASPDVVRRARRHGVTLVISTDSHHPSDLRRMEWGVRNARRGWAEKEMVANTWERRRFLEWAVQRRVSR